MKILTQLKILIIDKINENAIVAMHIKSDNVGSFVKK